jgi:O-6-methylguanine DNA methyltransferase
MGFICTHSFETSFGRIHSAASESKLVGVFLPGMLDDEVDRLLKRWYPDQILSAGGSVNREAEKQIEAYLAGKLKRFSLPVEVVGTAFQREVLRRVAGIPYGQTRSYGEIARAVGHPQAFRAVGTVNARNRLPLVIPCHRVVATGGLGGYGGGLEMKRKLLNMEGVRSDLFTAN